MTTSNGSGLRVPDDLFSSTVAPTIELWFKAGAGANGILAGAQAAGASSWAPLLSVGADGKLRGLIPVWDPPGNILYTQSGKCLDLTNYGTANGTPIQLWTCNGGSQQAWQRMQDGTVRAHGKCMDLNTYNNGQRPWLWDCHGYPNQVWQDHEEGLRNPPSGFCLDVPYGNGVDGALVQIVPCNAFPSQDWTMPQRTLPITSSATVTDGNWHHAVLTGSYDTQQLYLDGDPVGTIEGRQLNHYNLKELRVGTGVSNTGWLGHPGGGGATAPWPFGGGIDEVAFYNRALGATQVQSHYAARTSTTGSPVSSSPGRSPRQPSPTTTAPVASRT